MFNRPRLPLLCLCDVGVARGLICLFFLLRQRRLFEIGCRRLRGCCGRERFPEGGEGVDEAAGQSLRGGFVAVGHGEQVESEASREQPTTELIARTWRLRDDEHVTGGAVT